MKTEYEKLLEQQVADIEALWAKYSAILSSEEMITLSWATVQRHRDEKKHACN
jgi:hypothetical protein